ncbi:fibrinogen C domain-containing protein 1-B-like [Dysidea avara]|uniref:fibrinogen C domain-containing protein 1-B-like n=1 Tax=Dysidea avara TaxID=196820 RepID=UPI00331938B8
MLHAGTILLLLIGVVTATNDVNNAVVGCAAVQDNPIIENCCNLGYRYSTFGQTFNKPAVYTIKNFCGKCQSVQKAFCDTTTDGGGWLVIQRRQDGSIDFNRDWVDYEDGFGSLTGEFWYGLRAIHCLTNQGHWELRVDFKFTNGTKSHLSYSNFRIGPATERYRLTISGFYGITDDPFHSHSLNGMKFTTKDQDNDKASNNNCAANSWHGHNSGGWWYSDCAHIHFNHQYKHGQSIHLYGRWYSLPLIEMKIRPKDCNI